MLPYGIGKHACSSESARKASSVSPRGKQAVRPFSQLLVYFSAAELKRWARSLLQTGMREDTVLVLVEWLVVWLEALAEILQLFFFSAQGWTSLLVCLLLLPTLLSLFTKQG